MGSISKQLASNSALSTQPDRAIDMSAHPPNTSSLPSLPAKDTSMQQHASDAWLVGAGSPGAHDAREQLLLDELINTVPSLPP